VYYNIGNSDGDVEVGVIDPNGIIVVSTTVSMIAGGNTIVSLMFVALNALGNYTYTVEIYDIVTGVIEYSCIFTLPVVKSTTDTGPSDSSSNSSSTESATNETIITIEESFTDKIMGW